MDRLSKLKNQNSTPVSSDDSILKDFINEEKYPFVIQASDSDINLKDWLKENSEYFDKNLLEYGAILCRGFNIDAAEKFQDLVSVFEKPALEYKFRSSPRYSIMNNVYVSTTYPNSYSINMHSEHSYAPSPPDKIIFCCVLPASLRGETPIADNRRVLRNISEVLKNKFMEKGILYKRRMNGLLGLPWQEVFQTTDKSEVEAECEKNGISYNWLDEDDLVVTWKKKAIIEHPVSKESIWFNHGMFFNKYSYDEILLSAIDSDDELPNNTYFGDGQEFTKEEYAELYEAYKKATVYFPWEKGDVLFLDNYLSSHGRNSYEGERKIIVSMC
ncbi:TauD/TfdA family dioxygenase [Chryseobacterium sp.]|uniref:TauD/TfdA family dioxygenase n=1 Tax=Chryseobacterium sp. TaxID=1871047 RepID=UPI0031DA09B5